MTKKDGTSYRTLLFWTAIDDFLRALGTGVPVQGEEYERYKDALSEAKKYTAEFYAVLKEIEKLGFIHNAAHAMHKQNEQIYERLHQKDEVTTEDCIWI